MKKLVSLTLALLIMAGCMSMLATASADLETWYVKTGDGKGLNVRDIETGRKLGALPYGSKVSVEFFNRDHWAIIIWNGIEAKVKEEYLVKKNPGKYQGPVDQAGNVLSDSALGSETVAGLNQQYAALRYVNPYVVRVVPDTRTGTARFRWAPSKHSTLIMQFPANYQLTVLAASNNWLMVQDPGSNKIGFIATQYTSVQ